ncbi:MAG TPA: DUF4862 family protein [Trebonia sp.]|nr:DUF4862 family protein [Trebonia sp.]
MRVTLGAYAAAAQDWDTAELGSFYAALSDLPGIGGLELPAAHLDLLATGAAGRALPDRWDYEVTSLPGTMTALRGSAGYGLASVSAAGRAAAIADAEDTRAAVARFNDALGRPAVRTVTLVSAPVRDPQARDGTSRAALADSLGDLVSRDWHGAGLVIEHCDAAVPGQVAAKGFLDLDDELDVLGALPGTPALAVINWGRSAIERRDPAAPARHAAQARGRGLLGGVVLSGCADTASAWGPPWADTHLPPAGVRPPGGAQHESLMNQRHMTDFLRAAGPDARVAVKLSARPRDRDRQTRVRFLVEAVDEVRRAWTTAHAAAA